MSTIVGVVFILVIILAFASYLYLLFGGNTGKVHQSVWMLWDWETENIDRKQWFETKEDALRIRVDDWEIPIRVKLTYISPLDTK